MKVWQQEDTDIVRFVLKRTEWDALIRALAGAASRFDGAWAGLDILKTAEVDIETSKLVGALDHLQKYVIGCKEKMDKGDAQVILQIVKTALADSGGECN